MTRAARHASASEYPSGKSLSKIIVIAGVEACALVYAALVLTAAISPATPDIADRPYVGPAKIIRK